MNVFTAAHGSKLNQRNVHFDCRLWCLSYTLLTILLHLEESLPVVGNDVQTGAAVSNLEPT